MMGSLSEAFGKPCLSSSKEIHFMQYKILFFVDSVLFPRGYKLALANQWLCQYSVIRRVLHLPDFPWSCYMSGFLLVLITITTICNKNWHTQKYSEVTRMILIDCLISSMANADVANKSRIRQLRRLTTISQILSGRSKTLQLPKYRRGTESLNI